MKAGALFCGIGGFCAGFERVGIKTLWATDIDERVEMTYRQNFPDTDFFRADVRNIEGLRLPDRELEPVDVLHAGFPCQSFSMAGDRKGFEDERGKLFFELMRVISDFKDRKPSVLVFENSPYLQVGDRGLWFKRIKSEIQKAGYWFKDSNAIVLDPKEVCGSPQYRPRLFMVAFDRNKYRNGRVPEVNRVAGKIPSLSAAVNFDGEEDDRYYVDPENKYHGLISAKIIERKETLYQLRKFRVRVKDHCPTLTANMGLGGHNVPFVFDRKGLRKLTENECLKLQGFLDFEFPADMPSTSQYLQIGNSVHVDVAEALANSIRQRLEIESD